MITRRKLGKRELQVIDKLANTLKKPNYEGGNMARRRATGFPPRVTHLVCSSWLDRTHRHDCVLLLFMRGHYDLDWLITNKKWDGSPRPLLATTGVQRAAGC